MPDNFSKELLLTSVERLGKYIVFAFLDPKKLGTLENVEEEVVVVILLLNGGVNCGGLGLGLRKEKFGSHLGGGRGVLLGFLCFRTSAGCERTRETEKREK